MTDRIISLDAGVEAAFEERKQSLEKLVGNELSLIHAEDGSWKLNEIASFKFRPSLQCSGIAVPYHAMVISPLRGRGIGSALHELRINAAKKASMKLMVATTRLSNQPEMAIMHKFDWNPVSTFDNPRSGHAVVLWVKEL